MKPISVSPMGLSLLALVILSGCDDDKEESQPPVLSISISAGTPLANVQRLSLEFSPSHIYAPCDGESQATCYPNNVRAFTDDEGINRVVMPLNQSNCRTETVRVPPPTDTNSAEYRQWVNAGGEYQLRQVCDSVQDDIESNLILINTLAPDPLPTSYIARDFQFVAGTFSRIIVQAWGEPNHDDSYADLIDGRRCEVNVIFPNDLDPADIHHFADYQLPTFTMKNGEKWRIDLKFDFSAAVIDPERCEEGLDLYVRPGAATVTRTGG